jgi:hypothetical protein
LQEGSNLNCFALPLELALQAVRSHEQAAGIG